ncbi:hypothetical protein KAFR_0C03940 [Kazachstania africana CBS 2517]|uniref:Aquaporin n=1 Tax=Kazachstania africana (strain ATCC 22294 / BCRC 22015 / CBS 2517 / CECT 1963 / NBRC 1671 / NRRL Y-8276) TaxID=1071382 RepID=H2ASN5_KAZAF|nr:hypothetical protein KAFR_0C03940 [Kazachstania africana CBS 2517]CCF57385.1 hypothetical protein KAFR_0C03940 [Kazachstania africana CBS 2517]
MSTASSASADLEQQKPEVDLSNVPDNDHALPQDKFNLKNSRFNIGTGDSMTTNMIACYGEFVGTFIFLFCAYVICNVANHSLDLTYPTGQTQFDSHPSQIIMIALGFGFSLMFSVWCFAGVSGGALNPAVSLSLCLARAISPVRCCFHWLGQILGCLAAGGVVNAITPGGAHFVNTLGLDCSRTRGLFLEMFGTAFLCFTVLMTAIEKRETNFMAALPIGICLFIDHLALTGYTGTGVNPARSLGASVGAASFPPYHWIYWVGPLLGAFLGWAVWQILKIVNYEAYIEAEKKQDN